MVKDVVLAAGVLLISTTLLYIKCTSFSVCHPDFLRSSDIELYFQGVHNSTDRTHMHSIYTENLTVETIIKR